MWHGPHKNQKCTMEHFQPQVNQRIHTEHVNQSGVFSRRCAPQTPPHVRRPYLHFPPPPNYPPPHPSMSDDYMSSMPGPSTQRQQQPQEQIWDVPNDYSYAYYEPGPPTKHTNVPNQYPGGVVGHKTTIKGGSYRSKHTYLTRYGTEENIYEEISDLARARLRPNIQHPSMMSLNQSLVEEEVRRVQSGHKRVLGELNLSVEAMLMPSNSREGSDDTDRETEHDDQLADLLTVGPTDELLSPIPTVDLDSGFSGSSSGASYRSAAGSLRRGPERPKSSTSTHQKCLNSSDTSQSKGFWSKKTWRKLGISGISLNKHKQGKLSFFLLVC